MSIIALEKIVEPMYQVRPIFDVDYCTRKNLRADVLCSSDIRCRLLHMRKSSSRCIGFVQYPMSIIAREKIVEPMYQVRPIFDVDYCDVDCIGFVQYPMSIIAREKIVEPMYQVRPIFDVDYCTRKKSSSRCIMFVRYSMSIITLEKIVKPMYWVRPISDVDYCTRENSRANVSGTSDI